MTELEDFLVRLIEENPQIKLPMPGPAGVDWDKIWAKLDDNKLEGTNAS